ncbi:hypothetical protein JW887_04040 [Candidatus Dojkabacteria bacterium]|nr:hypothetical protein [Candidatus Dojkabacteria bacterium]
MVAFTRKTLLRLILTICLGWGSVGWASSDRITTPSGKICTIEIEQVPHQYEVIIRLLDELNDDHDEVICHIYRVLQQDDDMLLDTAKLIRVKKEYINGFFIGIYRDGKDMPHGTKIKVVYQYAPDMPPVETSVVMTYH